jgi:aspartate/methionine/tyrosine aminotransferase
MQGRYAMRSNRTAMRTHGFGESVIREMTRVAREHDAINLAQGFPDFPAPELLKTAACEAIRSDVNQYAITWGAPRLRQALALKYRSFYGIELDPETEITVTCGATEAVVSAIMATVDPGDEVIVLEPFYENYGPDTVLAQANAVMVPLDPPDYRLDPERLRAAFSNRTKAIVLNTPNNPTGRVLDREEMELVAALCREFDALVITDEIYEHIVYEGDHIPMMTLEGMSDRTITVSGLSKTFAVTGWRIGTVVAPSDLTLPIRKVHDFLTVGAPAPLQEACAVGLEELGSPYYRTMVEGYRERRAVLVDALREAGFACARPEGAYYVLADFSALSSLDDDAFARLLAREAGVAPVPGSSFFSQADRGRSLVRFAFCKQVETLRAAGERLVRFASAGG